VQVEAFVQIDQQYYAALKGCTGESAGTTALAVLVWGTTLYVANAGQHLLQQPAHILTLNTLQQQSSAASILHVVPLQRCEPP
jgi:hypothetical protein